MRSLAIILLALGLTACSSGGEPSDQLRTPHTSAVISGAPSEAGPPAPAPPASPPPTPAPTPTRTVTPAPADPTWVFFTDDQRQHTSPWFEGAWRVMIPFGCTPAPYYDPDPQCPGRQGFHHGVDVAMPCGTPLVAGRAARVLDASRLGRAYGTSPVLLRVDGHDLVVGHTTTVLVEPGQQLQPGQRFALAGDSGAPDGCHLHFEIRRAGGGVSSAVDPAEILALTPRGAG